MTIQVLALIQSMSQMILTFWYEVLPHLNTDGFSVKSLNNYMEERKQNYVEGKGFCCTAL
jgi:hypothetical protein